MKSARRLLTVPSLIITACCALLLSAVSVAQTPTTLRVAGLQDNVMVQRDERGIPYIEAKNDHDLYFAQGYVTASDRL